MALSVFCRTAAKYRFPMLPGHEDNFGDKTLPQIVQAVLKTLLSAFFLNLRSTIWSINIIVLPPSNQDFMNKTLSLSIASF